MPFDCRPSQQVSCIACPVAEDCPARCHSGTPDDALFASTPIPLPHPGKVLYASGMPAFGIYMVRAGCLKTVTHDTDGSEHVRRFHFPGDLVGLDALGSTAYPSSAVAVTASQVCRISKGQLQHLFQDTRGQLERMLERTSNELRAALALAGAHSAEQRAAAFLLEMEHRLGKAPGEAFELPMTRRDMGSHLRMATETVCRVLARFADQGWLQGGSELRILRRAPMRKLAHSLDVANYEVPLAA